MGDLKNKINKLFDDNSDNLSGNYSKKTSNKEINSDIISGIKDKIDIIKQARQISSKNVNSDFQDIEVNRDILNNFRKRKTDTNLQTDYNLNSKTLDQNKDYSSRPPLYTENGLNFQAESKNYNNTANNSNNNLNNLYSKSKTMVQQPTSNITNNFEKKKQNIINIDFSSRDNDTNQPNNTKKSLIPLPNTFNNANIANYSKNNGKYELKLGITNNIFTKENSETTRSTGGRSLSIHTLSQCINEKNKKNAKSDLFESFFEAKQSINQNSNSNQNNKYKDKYQNNDSYDPVATRLNKSSNLYDNPNLQGDNTLNPNNSMNSISGRGRKYTGNNKSKLNDSNISVTTSRSVNTYRTNAHNLNKNINNLNNSNLNTSSNNLHSKINATSNVGKNKIKNKIEDFVKNIGTAKKENTYRNKNPSVNTLDDLNLISSNQNYLMPSTNEKSSIDSITKKFADKFRDMYSYSNKSNLNTMNTISNTRNTYKADFYNSEPSGGKTNKNKKNKMLLEEYEIRNFNNSIRLMSDEERNNIDRSYKTELVYLADIIYKHFKY